LSSNYRLWIRIRIGSGLKNFVAPDWIIPDPQPWIKQYTNGCGTNERTCVQWAKLYKAVH
jgi:hypothetical protein